MTRNIMQSNEGRKMLEIDLKRHTQNIYIEEGVEVQRTCCEEMMDAMNIDDGFLIETVVKEVNNAVVVLSLEIGVPVEN